MIVKVHKTFDGKKIISICDKEVIGKIFYEKNMQLDLRSDFYRGEEETEDDARNLVRDSYILNVVGKRSVGFCLKQGWISEKNIIKVKNVPHAQCIFVGN